MRQAKKFIVLGIVAAIAAVPANAIGGGKDPDPPSCSKQHTKKCPKVKKGRMTGHGQNNIDGYGKVQWEFRNSVCGADRFPDLKVEWGDGERFVLTSYSTPLVCVDLPGINEGQPNAGFDTIIGQGSGRLNGVSGATARFTFTDRGEPGRNDRATIQILDAGGDVVLEVENITAGRGGNHQAHRLTGNLAN